MPTPLNPPAEVAEKPSQARGHTTPIFSCLWTVASHTGAPPPFPLRNTLVAQAASHTTYRQPAPAPAVVSAHLLVPLSALGSPGRDQPSAAAPPSACNGCHPTSAGPRALHAAPPLPTLRKAIGGLVMHAPSRSTRPSVPCAPIAWPARAPHFLGSPAFQLGTYIRYCCRHLHRAIVDTPRSRRRRPSPAETVARACARRHTPGCIN